MYRHCRLAALLAACVLLGAAPWASAATEVYCRSPMQCRQPDSMQMLLRPGGTEAILDANFGLVFQSPEGGWQYTCDDIFAGRLPYRTQITGDGRLLVPAMDGLHLSSDGCAWNKAGGALAGQSVYDVGFDRRPRTPGSPERLWAVGGEPRMAALSTDGGMTFVAKQMFPEALRMFRVVVAPSNPLVIYVSGFRKNVPLVMAVSTDGGDTWAIDDNASLDIAKPTQIVDFLGVSPDEPHTVYLMVTNATGDEIWKSTDKGKAPVKVLTLADQQQFAGGGFAFGANGQTVYVAGYEPLETPDRSPASLYVSHDAGQSWERRASPSTGPRYRCVAYRDGTLYACAGDQFSGDAFLVGTSTDEGKTWTPLIKLTDVRGPRGCKELGDRCAGTLGFLQSFQDAGAPPARDAGASLPEPPPPMPKPRGCACANAPAPGGGSALALALIALVAARRRRGPRA